MKVEYENHYLTDMDVANFARLSFAKLAENFSPESNHKLIQFLARGMKSGDWDALINKMLALAPADQTFVPSDAAQAEIRQKAHDLAVYIRKIPEHWVPFGHPHISLRMEAPVAIARQLFKHKIGMVESEESRRYISIEPVLYVPDEFRIVAEDIKQGSGGVHPDSDMLKDMYKRTCAQAILVYNHMIERKVAPEQARFILPQGVEVHWALTGSLYAFANLYNQRADSHAQKESQMIAEQIDAIIAPLYPVSWAALTKGEY
jgi:thymidylate synthase (FAD)